MIPSLMILTGSLIILALAGYWMRRALKAERRAVRAEVLAANLGIDLIGYQSLAQDFCDRLSRIIALETKSMAHVGKVAVAIAKGER